MSFKAHVGFDIKNDVAFEKACQKFDLTFDRSASRVLQKGIEVGKLEKTSTGRKLYMDVDVKWSSLARTIGEDGRKLMQAYTRQIVAEQVMEMGALVAQETLEADGSIELTINRGNI